MRIFKNIWFNRFARQEKISDEALIDAITRANNGLIDADLSGSVIKQRIAKGGRGKSSGYRTIIIFRRGERAFLFTVLPKVIRIILKSTKKIYTKSQQRNY